MIINLHPDSFIIIENNNFVIYKDTKSNFEMDYGFSLDSIPNGFEGRRYDSNGDNILYNNFTQEKYNLTWVQGDNIFLNIENIIAAKLLRDVEKEKTPEELIKAQILKSIQKGQEIIADIAYLNIVNNKTSEQIATMISEPANSKIFALLQAGALETAKNEILLLDETYFSTSEKNAIVDKINNFIA